MYDLTLERIAAEAQAFKISPLRILVTILTAPFVVLGWVAGKFVLCAVLAWAALRVGYREGRATSIGRRPTSVDGS